MLVYSRALKSSDVCSGHCILLLYRSVTDLGCVVIKYVYCTTARLTLMKDIDTTHFGYQKVNCEEKTERVGEVFHSVARKYDLMNDLMSFGIHRLWKRFTLELSGVRYGHKVLDLAGGTGDLSIKFTRCVGSEGLVVLCDINSSMLEVGRDRILDKGYSSQVEFIQANAERLPFADGYFDCITIGFGLRNVTRMEKALQEMQRVLKPGGRVLILEFSKPRYAWLNKMYDRYSFSVLPRLGRWIARDEHSYRYLAESIRMHPDQNRLKHLMESCGFRRCHYYNLTGGIVAVHRGFKLA